MLTLKLESTGQTTEDLLDALDKIREQVESGFTSGFDKGDGRSYSFDIEDEPSDSDVSE